MVTSEAEICNSALVKIGEERISSLDDAGKAARTCKRQYPIKRDQLLEDYNWTFAITRITLAPEATDPDFGFTARFLLPSDCIRFLGLYDSTEPLTNYTGTKTPHKLEGRYLLLDDTAASIYYIKRVTDVTKFSPQFAEALACLLAWDIAYDLTGGAKQEVSLKQRFMATVKRARLTQAIQGTPEIFQSSEWIDSRLSNGPAPGNPWAGGW